MSYASYASNQYPSRDDLVSDNLELVKRIAYHLAARLPSSVELNDLMQAGMIGLLEASNHFDAVKGASFETYAGIRIRGAMLDEVRRQDWTPRSVHQKHRRVSDAMHAIEGETKRAATPREIADRLGIELEDYHAIVADSAGCRLFSLDETLDDADHGRDLPDSAAPSPEGALQSDQFRARLADSVRRLPEREQLVLSLYYERELNLKEIGVVLGVSESRVCQIHGQALARLRAMSRD